MKRVVVIPAYNEERLVGLVVASLKTAADMVIVVDDGSSDGTGAQAARAGAEVVRHVVNRGVGAAWVTGFTFAREREADVVVVMDADGQHKAEDVMRLAAPIEKGEADVVIGTRDFSRNTPLARRIFNTIGNLTTLALFGVLPRDSQSGFRAFSKKALEKMELVTNHFEVCSEVFGEVKRLHLILKEVSIESVYTDYSLSKGQSFSGGIRTLYALIVHRIGRK